MVIDINLDIYIIVLYNIIYLYIYREGSIVYNIILILVLIRVYINIGNIDILYNNGIYNNRRLIIIWVYIIVLLLLLLIYIEKYKYNSIIYISVLIYLLILNSYNIDIWLICMESINILTSILLMV